MVAAGSWLPIAFVVCFTFSVCVTAALHSSCKICSTRLTLISTMAAHKPHLFQWGMSWCGLMLLIIVALRTIQQQDYCDNDTRVMVLSGFATASGIVSGVSLSFSGILNYGVESELHILVSGFATSGLMGFALFDSIAAKISLAIEQDQMLTTMRFALFGISLFIGIVFMFFYFESCEGTNEWSVVPSMQQITTTTGGDSNSISMATIENNNSNNNNMNNNNNSNNSNNNNNIMNNNMNNNNNSNNNNMNNNNNNGNSSGLFQKYQQTDVSVKAATPLTLKLAAVIEYIGAIVLCIFVASYSADFSNLTIQVIK